VVVSARPARRCGPAGRQRVRTVSPFCEGGFA
jgi:hypothetical protein